ncbi:MAG: hypothetical protein LRY67_06890 [Gammaproteobacteria bacterium]|nr:hypothetical protein [Gammaproteobacteria bacterium]
MEKDRRQNRAFFTNCSINILIPPLLLLRQLAIFASLKKTEATEETKTVRVWGTQETRVVNTNNTCIKPYTTSVSFILAFGADNHAARDNFFPLISQIDEDTLCLSSLYWICYNDQGYIWGLMPFELDNDHLPVFKSDFCWKKKYPPSLPISKGHVTSVLRDLDDFVLNLARHALPFSEELIRDCQEKIQNYIHEKRFARIASWHQLPGLEIQLRNARTINNCIDIIIFLTIQSNDHLNAPDFLALCQQLCDMIFNYIERYGNQAVTARILDKMNNRYTLFATDASSSPLLSVCKNRMPY